MTNDNPKQCSIGVLDTNDDPNMRFDEQGRCHYYHDYKRAEELYVFTGEKGEGMLQSIADEIKRDGKGKPYDCIMGLSGGVDSTYVAMVAKRLGLRPLAVHLDNGWNSEQAVNNIENIVNRLSFDLYTHVIDWKEFRDLQRAYLKASVIDIEILSDHAISALLYKLAGQHGIKHILSGTNIVTEFVLPPHWTFNKADHVNIKAIHKAFGTIPLKTYPFMDLKIKKWYQLIKKVRSHSILDYVPYKKMEVKKKIAKELGWQDYGGKHFESIFTRFYQGYILPTKFGVDKRKAHLTNLIYSGQMSKSDALQELESAPYDLGLMDEDIEFVTKKLGLTQNEFDDIMKKPPIPHTYYDVERSIYDMYPYLRPLKGIVNLLKKIIR